MAPVATFAAKQTKKEAIEAAQQLVLDAPPSLFTSPGGSSSSEEEWKLLRHRRLRQCKKTSTSLKSDNREIWSRRRFVKENYVSKTSTSEDKPNEIKLSAIHTVDEAFVDALDYKTYCHHNRFLTYNGKMAPRTAYLPKRIETIKKCTNLKTLTCVCTLVFESI